MDNEYLPAKLPDSLLEELQKFEAHCRDITGEDIVVIAYQQREEQES
ncbi:hypothetical protein ACFOQM_13345 [Paenibacillus sp. GCM10012307]|uniref:Uncharacterized protein n=1 Tax=Paenibacillus roseus TaxID=2798579 RepID=A0A934J3R6_9BACL|nr:hypothetical protein [Paenibacillus roseus]MBJ6362280.1 hypothetical protein [Paenibacillus roseus]